MSKLLASISTENFRPFGKVLAFPKKCTEQFYIVDVEKNNPWRVAVFRYTNKTIKVVENHPNSMETFEPLEGVTILLVAENHCPEDFEVFLLDKPVCLKKGIWHQVLAITPEAQVKITENLEVESVFYTYQEEKRIGIL